MSGIVEYSVDSNIWKCSAHFVHSRNQKRASGNIAKPRRFRKNRKIFSEHESARSLGSQWEIGGVSSESRESAGSPGNQLAVLGVSWESQESARSLGSHRGGRESARSLRTFRQIKMVSQKSWALIGCLLQVLRVAPLYHMKISVNN